MALLVELDGVSPTIGRDVFLAPNATLIGHVLVGHSALLEGCTIEDGAIVGMGAIALQRSRLGRRAMLAAGSVLGEGVEIEAETLAAGVPARQKKPLSGSALRWTDTAAEEY